MSNFKFDHSEPAEITRLLAQSIDVEESALNMAGWADYLYTGVECFCHKSEQYNNERKTWTDLMGGIEDVEEQLQRQLTLHPEVHHRLIVEGVVEPAARGMIVYRKMQGQNVFRGQLQGERYQAMKSIRSWLHQVAKYWEVVFTFSMADTAITLATYYGADQEEEESHGTFRRMFKHLNYQINPAAQRILGASGDVKIGPAKAEAIAAYFGTPIRAFRASADEWASEIPGIGKKLAVDYLRGIGRGDV